MLLLLLLLLLLLPACLPARSAAGLAGETLSPPLGRMNTNAANRVGLSVLSVVGTRPLTSHHELQQTKVWCPKLDTAAPC